MNFGKRIAFLGVFTSLALILSYIESLLPPIWAAVPGIKLGLGNIVTVFVLYAFSWKEGAIVSALRTVLICLLFSNIMTFAYSFAGAALSLFGMSLLKKIDWFSPIAVSACGGVLHNLGQILMAMILLETADIGYYFVVLAFTGILAGALIGVISGLLLRYLKKPMMKGRIFR